MAIGTLSNDLPLGPDPYKALEIANHASLPEIRSAHRKLVLKCHPDKVQDPALKALKLEEFQKIQQAYELLTDDHRRLQYDEQLKLWELRKAMGKATNKGNREKVFLRSPPSSQGTLIVQGQVNGLETDAIPDTGAGCNIMAESFAKRLHLVINEDPSHRKVLRMTNCRTIEAKGIVAALWKFNSDPYPAHLWHTEFQVISDFVEDVVLGSHFLFTTQTMSQNQYRLSRRPHTFKALSLIRVNILGSMHGYVHVRGDLEQETVSALPDSGSEFNLISYDYVKRRNWFSRMDLEDRNRLHVADGTSEMTEGSVVAHWAFPGADSVEMKFHVLRDCSHDIIIGQDILEVADAFLLHKDAFEKEILVTDIPGLNMVWVENNSPKKWSRGFLGYSSHKTNPSGTVAEDPWDRERKRREASQELIQGMPEGKERDVAEAGEEILCHEFERTYKSTSSAANSVSKKVPQ